MDIDYMRLPAHIRTAVQTYIETGKIPGDFLRAVICNDLSQSFARADPVSRERLFDIVQFFHNEAPNKCWGSSQKMTAWSQSGGLLEQQETRDPEPSSAKAGD